MRIAGKIFFTSLAMLIFSSAVFAITHTSSNYTLRDTRVVASGGEATSTIYFLTNVEIGSPFGGIAQSSSYSLNAYRLYEEVPQVPPNPPTLNSVTTPTNLSPQNLTGTKESDTSIYINGYEAVPINPDTTWSYNQVLTEGDNILLITSRNAAGLESDAVSATIVLDTIPPTGSISINSGTAYTSIESVILTLSATDATTNVVEMSLSNDNITWSTAEPYSTTKVWTLASGNGTKIVYVKYKDEVENWSSPVSDTIVLDTTPPSTPLVTDDGVTTYYPDRLHATWSSVDNDSGITEYQYCIGTSPSGTNIVPWTSNGIQAEVTHTGLSLIPGQVYYISVKARNGAELWSAVGSTDGIQVIQTAPSINNITPPDGSLFEVGDIVSFNIAATDAEGDTIEYKIVIDGMTVKDWNQTSTHEWYTTTESVGTHNITVYVKDRWNNENSQNIQLYLVRKAVSLP